MVVGIVTGIIIPGNVMLRTKRAHSFYVLTMKVHIIPVASYGCEYHNRYHTLRINSTACWQGVPKNSLEFRKQTGIHSGLGSEPLVAYNRSTKKIFSMQTS